MITNPNDLPFLALCVLVLHIAGGFIGMYAGLVPLFTRKGGGAHRRWGIVFVWGMGIAAFTALPLAWWRSDAFQAAIGLLAGYLTWFGVRSLTRSIRHSMRSWDIAVVIIALLLCLGMIGVSLPLWGTSFAAEARTSLVFGILGLLIALRDLRSLKSQNPDFAQRVMDHLLASCLAVVVAFSSFLNTQFYRLTGLEWNLDARMLLPVALSFPFFIWGVYHWTQRLRTHPTREKFFMMADSEATERERMYAFGKGEGISFLLLLGVAVPLKYMTGHAELVRWLGPLHGALFLLYSISVILAARAERWTARNVLIALVAGVLPLGTFMLEAWWSWTEKVGNKEQ
ncbi:MAG: hypothetical protein OHK0029_04800 [Armatimonadaceae bacterium]